MGLHLGNSTVASLSNAYDGRSQINVKYATYGALGDGTTDDRAALLAADADAITAGLPLYFPPGTYKIATSVSLTSHLVFAPGATLKPSSGAVVTLAGNVVSRSGGQVFDASAGGSSSFVLTNVATIQPRWFGADPTGTVVSTLAFNASQNAMPATGGVLDIGPGAFKFDGSGALLRKSNVHWKGAPGSTIFAGNASMATLMQVTSTALGNILVEGITFDLANITATGVTITGAFADRMVVRNCVFINCVPNCIGTGGAAAGITIEDCTAYGTAKGQSTFFSASGGLTRITIRRNRLQYLLNGISITTGSNQTDDIAERIAITDNRFDLGWYTALTKATNVGTPTYTSTVLTDTGAAFSGVAVNDTVRVMGTAASSAGTGVTYTRTSLTDPSATFLSAGILPGHIVRAGTGFAIVSAVKSNTVLRVEEWLSDTDRTPVLNPASATAYTVYNVLLGRITASTGTTLTVQRWHDMNGATATTPSSGTRYELLYARPNYAINAEYAFRNSLIAHNVLRRGWSDQISVFGYKLRIIGNDIADGQDMGITTAGQHNTIIGNIIHHQGGGGIFCGGNDTLIEGNVVTDSVWQNNANTLYLGDIILAGSRNKVHGNHCERIGAAIGLYGIVVSGTGVDGNDIRNNTTRGHATAGMRLNTSGVTGTRGDFPFGTTWSIASSEAPKGRFVGTGSPEGVLTAGIGSVYTREDGGAGTSMYVKESGTGNTGWIGK